MIVDFLLVENRESVRYRSFYIEEMEAQDSLWMIRRTILRTNQRRSTSRTVTDADAMPADAIGPPRTSSKEKEN